MTTKTHLATYGPSSQDASPSAEEDSSCLLAVAGGTDGSQVGVSFLDSGTLVEKHVVDQLLLLAGFWYEGAKLQITVV